MRLQLALNVKDLDAAVDFYTTMFATEPAKRRPGYANFAIAEPPLKLVLFESDSAGAESDFHHLNHLGVEVDDASQVTAADQRLTSGSLATTGVDEAICCYAEKTETWTESPDGARWEWYVKTGDAEQMQHESVGADTCCS